MSCGLTEEELAALELEAASHSAAAGVCGRSERCDTNSCTSSRDPTSKRSGGDHESSAKECCNAQRSTCMKCKTAPAVVLVRQREPLCQACLEAGVSGKVRSLKSHKLLLPNDHVAIAFSGGFSSQALLCNVLPMRKDSSTQRKERGKIEFNVTVIHINEAAAYGMGTKAAAAHASAVHEAAYRCGGAAAAPFRVLVVPLSDVFLLSDGQSGTGPEAQGGVGRLPQLQQQPAQEPSPASPCTQAQPAQLAPAEQAPGRPHAGGHAPGAMGCTSAEQPAVQLRGWCSAAAEDCGGLAEATAQRNERLRALLQSVPDPTGREDLLHHLRGRLLAATAARLGATKLLRGDTATGMAARVIAETSKGRGYSLPGDIQLVDARGLPAGEPPVVYPMREVTVKEVAYFCRLRGLQPVQLAALQQPGGPRGRSINDLAASFIDGLQASLPSTIFTVLRTASALQPFPFNSVAAVAPPVPSASAGAPSAPIAQAQTAAQDATATPQGSQHTGAAGGGGNAPWGRTPLCCALCRAPLSQREREAIAAAAAARAAAAVSRCGSGPGVAGAGPTESSVAATVQTCSDNASSESAGSCSAGQERGTAAAAYVSGKEDGEEEANEDLSAPFCLSCRSQILFSPGHPEVVSGGVSAMGLGTATRSATLPLLPSAFRAGLGQA